MTTIVMDVRTAASVVATGPAPVRPVSPPPAAPAPAQAPPALTPLAADAMPTMPAPPGVEEIPSQPLMPATEPQDGPEQPPAPGKPEAAQSQTFDLTIEALPHWRLIQPIPVAVRAINEHDFTGTIHDLNMSATGASPNHVLLILKEQIEALYEELGGRAKLDAAQKKYLAFMRFHISTPLLPSKRLRF